MGFGKFPSYSTEGAERVASSQRAQELYSSPHLGLCISFRWPFLNSVLHNRPEIGSEAFS
jgi:hypothetical protein